MVLAQSRFVASCLGPIILVLACAAAVRADNFTWCNVPGPGVGNFVDGSVTDWNAAGLWWDGAANVNWPATGAAAVFPSSGTGSATVTISSPTVVQGLTFLPLPFTTSPQYTISNLGDASQFQLSGTISMPGNMYGVSYDVLDGPVTFNGPVSATNIYGGLTLQGSVSNVGTDAFTFAGNTLSLNKSGSAVAIPGPLVMNSGVAVVASPSQLSPSSSISLAGGNLSVTATSGVFPQPITVSSPGSTISTTSGNVSFTGSMGLSGAMNLAAASGGTAAFNGAISGTGGVMTNGGGTIVFNGPNSSTGNVSINGYGAVVFSGAISAAGSMSINNGTVILNGPNTYQGGTTLSYGTLVLGSNSVPGVSGPVGLGSLSLGSGKIVPSGGDRTLANAISIGGAMTFGDASGPALLFTGSTTITTAGGAPQLTVNNTTTFAGPISGTTWLTMAGSGTCILGGGSADAVANSYSGKATVYSGTMILDKMAGTPAVSGSLSVSGGTVLCQRAGMIGSNAALTVTSGEMVFNDNNLSLRSLNYSGGTIAGLTGTITLSGSTTPLSIYNVGPPINYGLAFTGASPGGSPPDIICSTGGTPGTGVLNGPIDLGSVTRWFSSSSSYGTLQVNGAVSGSGGLAVEPYSTVDLTNSGNSYAGTTQLGAYSTLCLGVSQAISATSNLIDNGTLNMAGYSATLPTISGSGTVTMGGGTLTVGGSGGATTFSGVVAADPGEFVKAGSGSLTLTQSTTRYQGFVEVQGGTLTMAGGFLGAGAGVDVQPGARLSLAKSASGADFSMFPLTNAGTVDLLSGSYSYSTGGTLAGTVNISGSGVTLSTSGNLVLPGVINWTGGTLSGGALGGGTVSVPSAGSASITALGQALSSGVTLDVGGQATLAGSGSIFGASNNTQLLIESAGTLDINGNAGFALTSGTPTINNAGLFRKLAGTGTSAVAWRFNNTGTVDVESGTLALSSGGTESGMFTVGPSSAVAFVGGTFNINGPMTVTGSAVLSSANLGGSGSASFSNLLWSSGTLSNTGGIDIAANGSLLLSGTDVKALSGALLSIDGSGLWSTPGTLTAIIGAAPSAMNIDATGVFDLPNSGTFATTNFASASLNNAGLLRKLSGTGSVVLGSGWTWTNTGTIDVEKGSLVLGSGTGSGTFTVGSGASLLFSSGTCNLSGATFTGSGTVNLTAPIVRFDSAASMSGLTVLGSGSITGGGVVSCNELNWTGGTLAGGGVSIPSGGSLSISGSGNRALSTSHLAIGGSATLTTTGSIVASVGASTLDILSGGLLDVQSNAAFSTGGAGSGTVNNAGTFRKSLSTSASLGAGWSFSNSGTIDVRGGTLAISSLTSSGVVNVATGAVLWVTGTGNLAGTTFSNSGGVGFGVYPIPTGSYALDGASLGGSGTYVFNGGTATVGSPTTLAGAIAVSPIAAMKIDADTLFSGPVLFDGMLAGSGTTTFRNLTFQGAMSGSGTTAIASGGTMSMPVSSLSYITRPLTNSGLLALTGGANSTISSTILNQSSGTVSLVLTTGAQLLGSGTISTAGLFHVQGSGNCLLTVPFDNSGVMEATVATVNFGPVAQISGGTLTGGTWIADSNGKIMFSSQVVANQAKIVLDGALSNIPGLASNFENDGTLTLQDYATVSLPGNVVNTGTINLGVNTIMTAGTVSVQDGGTLIDNGSLYTAAMTVSTGGTLSGSGTAGAVTLDGHLAPGNSPGKLTLSRLQLDPGCDLDFDLGGTSGNDLLVISTSNGLTLSGGLVNVSDWNNGLTPGTYPLIQYSGTPLTSLGGLGVGEMPDGFGGTLLLNSTGPATVDLQVFAVPEPSTLVLLGGLMALVLCLRLRS